MDLDLQLISAMLRDKISFFKIRKSGILSEHFFGEYIDGFKFVNDHVKNFGEIPSIDFFSAKTKIVPIESIDNIDVLISEIKDRALWNKLKTVHEKCAGYLKGKQPRKAIEEFQKVIRDSYKEGISGSKIDSLLSLGDDVVELYDKMKRGDRGILSPWPSMNEQTLGWWGGDSIVFVGRMGLGKTFCMLMLARKAWMDGKKVLFVGTEMSRVKLALRFYAIHMQLPYKDFRRGQLDTIKENKFREVIAEMSTMEGLEIVGDDFDCEMVEIEAATEQVRPDILFVDGLYLVKNIGKDRHSRVSNTADDLKRLARRMDIPVVASTQFNREVATNTKSTVSAANVAVSDVIGWTCDCMFGMYQTDDMREDKTMGFKALKLREGENADFFCHWDFDVMNFDQIDIGDAGNVSGLSDDYYNNIPGQTITDAGSENDLF